MNLIDQLISLKWLKSTIATLSIFLVLFIVIDLFSLVENLVNFFPSIKLLSLYIPYRIFYASYFLLPIATSIGGFWTIISFKRTNEWVSFLNSGYNPVQLISYPIYYNVFLTIAMILSGIFILPRVSTTLETIRDHNFKSKTHSTKKFNNIHFKLLDGRTVKISSFIPGKKFIRGIVISRKKNGRIKTRWDSSTGYYRQGDGWILDRVEKRTFKDSGFGPKTTIQQMNIPLEPPQVLDATFKANPRNSNQHPSEFRFHDLITAIDIKDKRNMNIRAELTYLHWKFSFPLTIFILGMFGLYLGIYTDLNRTKGIAFALVGSFLYWISFNTLMQLGQSTINLPFFSSFIPYLSVYSLPIIICIIIFLWPILSSDFNF